MHIHAFVMNPRKANFHRNVVREVELTSQSYYFITIITTHHKRKEKHLQLLLGVVSSLLISFLNPMFPLADALSSSITSLLRLFATALRRLLGG